MNQEHTIQLKAEWLVFITGKFLFKNNILSTFSGFKQLLLLDTVTPAAENTHSAAVDVAGTHNIDLASLAMLGYLASLIFHHSNIFIFQLGGFTCKYISISS